MRKTTRPTSARWRHTARITWSPTSDASKRSTAFWANTTTSFCCVTYSSPMDRCRGTRARDVCGSFHDISVYFADTRKFSARESTPKGRAGSCAECDTCGEMHQPMIARHGDHHDELLWRR